MLKVTKLPQRKVSIISGSWSPVFTVAPERLRDWPLCQPVFLGSHLSLQPAWSASATHPVSSDCVGSIVVLTRTLRLTRLLSMPEHQLCCQSLM